MGKHAVESILGGVVIVVAVMFLHFAYKTAEVRSVSGYTVTASFYKIGGLNKGGDVRISGIKIGTVTDTRLDPKTFDAVISMSIASDVQLPSDTVAAIASEGIVGNKYVRLDPGRAKTFLAPGGKISQTKDFRSLEDQVGEIIFLATGGETGGDDSTKKK